MSDDPDAPRNDGPPETADEQRARTRGANRLVAWLLVGISLIFLAGALAVGLLVQYAPY